MPDNKNSPAIIETQCSQYANKKLKEINGQSISKMNETTFLCIDGDDMNGEIVEIHEKELCKCGLFWELPEDMTTDRLYGLVKNNIRRAFVFKTQDGYIGGCALFVRDNGNGHLSHFDVAPAYRRQGIGSRLIDFAEQFFKERGVKTLGLNVMRNNTEAIRLYERKGFTYAYTYDNMPEKIYMTKKLTDENN